MKYNDNGLWKTLNVKVTDTLPVGTIIPYAGSTIPSNYMKCEGQALSRIEYDILFSAIGTTYGAGDGSTTFNLPNLKGRVITGIDSNDTDFDTLGETGGEKTHTLTVNEMPSHNHGIKDTLDMSTVAGQNRSVVVGGGETWNMADPVMISGAGGDQPHNNLQPYIVLNYIIKVLDAPAIQAQVVNGYSTSSRDSYSCDYVNKLNTYSTNEIRIGTWIDGKPIYRKVIANEVDMTNGSEISLSSISNMSSLVSIQSKELKVSDNAVFYNNYYDSSTNKFNLFHYIANNSLYLYAGSNTHYTTTVIIEYTKTTD